MALANQVPSGTLARLSFPFSKSDSVALYRQMLGSAPILPLFRTTKTHVVPQPGRLC